ncbi:MAG TPA: lysoplasmalogenase [Aeromicrobium sp.]|nr:lysoplasmalogenase [Aeromicrobium sp.]HKY57484.1 lysoplasmalogenase [Aeromicrobium sp.]
MDQAERSMAAKSPWIIAFGVVLALHLLCRGLELDPYQTITKILLAPLLALWAWQLEGPRLLIVGLVFCFFGDLFMDLDPRWFIAGMAAFALAHICFISLFIKRGAIDAFQGSFAGPFTERWRGLLVLLYVVGAIVFVIWAWPGFPAEVRPAVPVYALLLTGTATTSVVLDTRAGVGAALFVVSDALIAVGWDQYEVAATWQRVTVMVLYALGIFLITAGVLNRERRTKRIAADGFDITQRTDCWPRLP